MKKNRDDLPPGANAEPPDPLRSIGDIGPEYAKALHQIGIHQPADLLRYTPEQLARELLEKTGKKVTLSRIQTKDWFGQAKQLAEILAASNDADKAIRAEESNPAEWHERGMFTLKFLSLEDPSDGQKWKILVYDEEGPGPEVPFDGLDPAPWSKWIIEQLNLDASVPEDTAARPEPPVVEPEITRILPPAPQPQNPDMVEFAFNNVDVIRSEEDPENRLVVQAGFSLLGDSAREATRNRTPYRITFHLIDLEYQTSRPISSIRGRLEPEQDAYQVIENFPIPGPGKYELHTTLNFEESTAIFCDGPIFNVVQVT